MTGRPDLSVVYALADDDPRDWARRREDQGWDSLAISDHLATDYRPPFPHLWVSAAAIATVTERVSIQTAYVNGVVRHPVDTAQAARQLQQISDGRFELGYGAGWYEPEVTAIGRRWPSPGERAAAFVEAVQVLRPLLAGGSCTFTGDHYRVDVAAVGPRDVVPVPLVASVGGTRTVREVTPHVDRVEVKPAAAATRGGSLDWDRYATVTDDDVLARIAEVRAIRPDITIDLFVICNAVDDSATRDRADHLRGSFAERFFGDAGKVAESIARLGEWGIGRVQLSPLDPASLEHLLPHLID